MNVHDAIKGGMKTAEEICLAYLGDLTDEEMLMRPNPGCNHINWQVGHLIASENQMVNGCTDGVAGSLPAGFAEKYSKEAATSDDAASFESKADLLSLIQTQRAATLAALEGLSEGDLSKPTPESMRSYAPTVGDAFNLQGAHWLMHGGQWAVVRRQLGRPPLF